MSLLDSIQQMNNEGTDSSENPLLKALREKQQKKQEENTIEIKSNIKNEEKVEEKKETTEAPSQNVEKEENKIKDTKELKVQDVKDVEEKKIQDTKDKEKEIIKNVEEENDNGIEEDKDTKEKENVEKEKKSINESKNKKEEKKKTTKEKEDKDKEFSNPKKESKAKNKSVKKKENKTKNKKKTMEIINDDGEIEYITISKLPTTTISFKDCVTKIISKMTDEEWHLFVKEVEEEKERLIIPSDATIADLTLTLSNASKLRLMLSNPYAEYRNMYDALVSKETDGLLRITKKLNAKGKNVDQREMNGIKACMDHDGMNLYEVLGVVRRRYYYIKESYDFVKDISNIAITLNGALKLQQYQGLNNEQKFE